MTSLPSTSNSSSSYDSSSSSSSPSTPPSTGPSSPLKSALTLTPLSIVAPGSESEEAEEGYALPSSMRSLEEYGSMKVAPSYLDVYPSVPDRLVLDGPLDKGTPDEWIKRDQRLVRLTGKHPCNVEAPLKDLFNSGFLTPSELFYVRSHGTCPVVDGELLSNWRCEVSGLVKNTLSLSLADLKSKFEVVTLPVTLVCAGNRRKEQNVVKKGLGFNWGAAGLSTGLFTGVYLADILAYAQPTPAPNGDRPRHVIFEGIDQLPQGPYGTSQTLARAKDKAKGMLICWAMNGLPLEPDHGFPLRLVVPGQIGGRSVKWLNKIEVSHEESQHHLHFWDNKLIPTEVEPDQARAEKKWWYDPKYIINDLNVNSAIAQPDHDEVLDLSTCGETYAIKGYAYAGGGRRVTRIEVSLDEGTTWKLSEITYPEDLYRAVAHSDSVYGTLDLTERDECFCWCFFSYEVPVESLKNASAIMVRAMDESLALQQRDMYWNAMSMMNNWWFRVAIHSPTPTTLLFEHPTLAGTKDGGWMQRMKDEGRDISNPMFRNAVGSDAAVPTAMVAKQEVVMTKEGVNRKISMEEVKAHSSPEEPWFVVLGEVYDGTGFLKDHPGGAESITLMAGEDATEDFMAIHSPQGKLQLAPFHIGTLVVPSASLLPTESATAPEVKTIDPIFLNKKKWKKTKLIAMDKISHDTIIYKFELESPEQRLGLPVGHHVFIRGRPKKGGDLVQRAYTPVSRESETGVLDLLVKLYLPSVGFPEGGKMSHCFAELEIGDEMEVKGPAGHFEWTGQGMTDWHGIKRKYKNIGMVCGGSGITPILQVLRAIFEDDQDTETKIWIVNGNKSYDDILCREELDLYLESHKHRYSLHHTLGMVPPDWKYSQGRMKQEMFQQYLPAPDEDSLVLYCGSDPMLDLTVKPGLAALGWDIGSQLVVF
ncbi:hypothetical protein BDY24DRAFT_400640 [Mrakia frigida]|uniref:uncharacterized protein n=1 Tax=Mrakia frigida TaxID=29902 RepID=UPI003FCC052D